MSEFGVHDFLMCAKHPDNTHSTQIAQCGIFLNNNYYFI